MENTELVTAYLQQRCQYPEPEANEDGLVLSVDGQSRLTLSGSPLDLIGLADLLVSLALSGENRGQHWHLDSLTLLSESSQLPELILTRK